MLAHKYVIRLSASIIFSVSSFISLMVMTRYAGEAYGLMMWGMSIVATVNAAFDLGLHLTNTKKVADRNELGACVSAALAIRAGLTAVMVAVLLIFLGVLSFTGDGLDSEITLIVLIFLAYFVMDGFRLIIVSTFMGRMDVGKESAVQISEYVVRASLLIIFALAGTSAVILSLSYLAGMVVAVFIGLVFLVKLKVRLTRPKMAREYLRFAFPLALPISLIAAIMFVDKAVIGAFWGSMEVGYYAAAYGLFFAFVTVGTLMNTLMLSHMTRLYSKGKTDDMNNTLWTSQRYLAAFLLPVAAFLVIFGNDAAVILFGRDFAESGPIISLLALVIYPMTLGNIMSHVLLSTNRNVSYGRVSMIYAVSVIVMFFLFVPSEILGIRLFGLGAAGAALSLLIGSLLLFFMVSVILKRTESLRNYPKLILYVIAALAVGAVLYVIREYAHIGGILWFVVLGLLSIIVYMGILIVTREFKRDDFKFIMDTINPKNLYDDIKEEMKDD